MTGSRSIGFGVAIGALLAFAIAATSWWTGANGGGGVYAVAGNAFTVLAIWGWLGLVVLLATGERRVQAKRRARIAVLVSVTGMIAAPAAHQQGVRAATSLVAETSGPVIAAIEAWEADNGAPPARLHHLVPSYLDVVPETALELGRLYTYERVSTLAATGRRLTWDVGPAGPSSRDGVLDPSTGSPERASFAALIGSAGRVESVRAWRIDRMTDPVAFDAGAWRAAPGNARRGAALTLAREDRWVGATEAELVAALGPPEGEHPTVETTFALRVGMDIGNERPGQHVYLDAECEPQWQRWTGEAPAVRSWFYLPK